MKAIKSGLFLASSTGVRILLGIIGIKIIAINIGSQGFGLLGQFMSLMSLISITAGGGISNGIISKISQSRNNSNKINAIISAGFWIGVIFSTCLGIILFVTSTRLSIILFENKSYSYIIKWLSVLQFFNIFSILFGGYLNGLQKSKSFSFITICSSIIGIAGLVILVSLFRLPGSMLGLIWLAIAPGIIFLLAYFKKLKYEFNISNLKKVEATYVTSLLKYSIMLILSACLLPLTQVYLRKLILNWGGWEQVGLWQSAVKLSDAGLTFLNVIMVNYYLPELGKTNNDTLGRLIRKTFFLLVPILLVYIIFIYILKSNLISLFYSSKFIEASKFLIWQVIGDAFKVLCLVFGFLIVLKEKLFLYILFEVSLFSSLSLLSYFLIPKYGTIGASYAYTLSYGINFFAGITYLSYLLKTKKFL